MEQTGPDYKLSFTPSHVADWSRLHGLASLPLMEQTGLDYKA
jgi:hypothetical protein